MTRKCSKNSFFFLSICFLLFANCTEKKYNTAVKPPMIFTSINKESSFLDTKFIADEKKAHGKSVYFYCGIQMLYGREHFIYMDDKDSLSFINLSQKSINKIYIGNILKGEEEYHRSRIEGNLLFLLDRKKKHLYQYLINEDFTPVLQKEYNLNKSGKLDNLFFAEHPDATEFICKGTHLLINYGKHKHKNYIDREAIIYFNLNDPNLKPQFAIQYPDNYHTEEIRNRELLFDLVNDSSLAFTFMQHDQVGIYNIKSNSITQSQLNRKNGYLVFDEKKHGNLGYTAKYLLTNENNYKLFNDSLQRIYLLKRLSKAQKKDSIVMECYVFTNQLTPIHCFKLNEEVCPTYIYKYQQGFLAFTKDLSKAYYYAFN